VIAVSWQWKFLLADSIYQNLFLGILFFLIKKNNINNNSRKNLKKRWR